MRHVGAHGDELLIYLFDQLNLSLLENCLQFSCIALNVYLIKGKTNPAVL